MPFTLVPWCPAVVSTTKCEQDDVDTHQRLITMVPEYGVCTANTEARTAPIQVPYTKHWLLLRPPQTKLSTLPTSPDTN